MIYLHRWSEASIKMIQLCTHKIKKLLKQYKELQIANGENLQISIIEVCDLKSRFWKTEHSYCSTTPCDRLPAGSQRRLLELSSLKDRAQEEKQLSIGDLIRTTVFYREHPDACNDKIVQYLEQYASALHTQMTLLPLWEVLFSVCLVQVLVQLLQRCLPDIFCCSN